jgi:branched-chain amino acid transport system ATP-binding protein
MAASADAPPRERAAPPPAGHAGAGGAPLLSVRNVIAGHGAGVVLHGLSLDLALGEDVVIIGRNGVGKTTLVETIIGLTSQHGGEIWFDGQRVDRLPPYRRNRLGIGWVPQEREVFPSLTVEENLTVVAQRGHWSLERVYGLFPRLKQRRRNYGNQLSGGEQQMLAIGRALMTNPRLLLLDEPVEGLAPVIVLELVEAINRMRRDSDMAVLMVEQKYEIALKNTERCIAIDRGAIVYEGPSAALLGDERRLSALVGIEAGAGG